MSKTSQALRSAASQHRWLVFAALLALVPQVLGLGAMGAFAVAGACLATWAALVLRGAGRPVPAAAARNSGEVERALDGIPSQIWRADASGNPNFVNRTLFAWSGLGVEHMDDAGRLASAIGQAVHPDDRDAVAAGLGRSFSTGVDFAMTYRQRHHSGDYRWIQGRVEPKRDAAGVIEAWYGVCLDIDDEVRAREQLARSERELRQIVDTVPAFIWLLTPEGRSHYFNRQGAEWAGLGIEELHALDGAGRDHMLEALIHPDDRGETNAIFRQALAAGTPVQMKMRLRRKDGVYRWLASWVSPLRDENGQITRWYGVSFDIDDEVRAIDALRRSEQHLQQVIDTVPVLIIRATPQGQPVYASKRLKELHGFELDDFGASGLSMGDALALLVHPDDRAEVEQAMRHSFATGEPFRQRYRQRRVDGNYRWIEGRLEALRDDAGSILEWYGVNLDVDDEVQAQENLNLAQGRLIEAAHAASLAELSASFAHEVSQPLAAIVANAAACQRWLASEAPPFARARETAAEMTRNAEAAADIVYRIRALFRSPPGARTPTSLNEVVTEVRRLMSGETQRRGGRIDTALAPDLAPVAIDRQQIQQVLVNLIRNGLQAMEELPAASRILTIRTEQRDDTICVEVVDAGPGIADAQPIFEAFFTTRPDGIGMGLAICKSIAEAHGGRLLVNSVSGKTAFSLVLPM
jgi:PAS domain S-box-containing protein